MSYQENETNAEQSAFQVNEPTADTTYETETQAPAEAPAVPTPPPAPASAAPAAAPAKPEAPAVPASSEIAAAPASVEPSIDSAVPAQAAVASVATQPAEFVAAPAQPAVPAPASVPVQSAGNAAPYQAQPMPGAPQAAMPQAAHPQGISYQQGQAYYAQPGTSTYTQPSAGSYAQPATGTYAQPNTGPYAQAAQFSYDGYAYGQPSQPQSPYATQPNTFVEAPSTDGKAIGALICGIFAILFFFVPVLGVVLGIVAIVLALVSRKNHGSSGFSTAGLVTGIVAAVIGLLFTIFVGWIIVTMASSIEDYDPDQLLNDLEEEYGYDEFDTNPHDGAVSGTFDDEDDQAAYDAAVEVFDTVASPSDEAKRNLADSINNGFKAYSQMDLEEIGVDPADIVNWMTEDVSYEVTSVTTFEDGTGSVYYTSHVRDVDELIQDFADRLHEYRLSGEADNISEDEMKQKIGEIMKEAMSVNTEVEDNYSYVDVQKFDGKWALTSTSLNEVPNDFYDTYWY